MVNLQFAPCLWSNAKSRQVTGRETKGDNNVKKVYCPKNRKGWCNIAIMHPKDADGMANSEDPDQTASICPNT